MSGILTDVQIKQLANQGMIDPFVDQQVRKVAGFPVVSYGLSSTGYDIRLDTHILKRNHLVTIDPKSDSSKAFEQIECQQFIRMMPGDFILGNSIERFAMPNNVVGICVGKSTYARCGINVLVTPLETNWRGFLTVEVANVSGGPVDVYVNEGIAQIIFHRLDSAPSVTYADRAGKYNDQEKRPYVAKV